MPYQNILVEKANGIATVILNRPEARNAVSNALAADLQAAVAELKADKTVRVVIITGAGHSFCAGADLKEAPSYTPADFRRRRELLSEVFGALENLEPPVIAAVNGYALGGGCELALACDVRIASEDARFAFPEPRVGVVSPAQRLVRLVGPGRAKEILFTTRQVDAQEAERIGLVNRIVPQERLMEAAREMAAQMMASAPLALKYTKVAANLALAPGREAGSRYEADTAVLCAQSEDRKEALAAWRDKRQPNFKGQ